MCLFRKCDETIIERKEYPSPLDRLADLGAIEADIRGSGAVRKRLVTTIRCNACGKIRIDQRDV